MPTENYHVSPDIIETYLKKDKSIRIVSLAIASNITGYIIDYKQIYHICQKYNVLLFLDASQYAPHAFPDLRYCDAMAYCGHKMYAPFGCGVLAGRKSMLDRDGNSLTGGGNVIYVSKDGKPLYKSAPFLHEAGTPNGIGAVTMSKSHDILADIGEQKLNEHCSELCNAIRKNADKLIEAGYDVYFYEETENRTPILIVDNKRLSNALTVEKLQKPIGEFTKSVFVRQGAFCAYRIIEQLKPNVIPLVSNKLNPDFSLIRLSAGLINDTEDINYATDKLVAINS